MPIYEYQCEQCRYYLEVMQKLSDKPLRKCPSCGKNALTKLISAPSFRLKGSGWYETDFKSEQERKRNLAGAEEATEAKPAEAAASADKSEAKTEAAPKAAAEGKSEAKAESKAGEGKITRSHRDSKGRAASGRPGAVRPGAGAKGSPAAKGRAAASTAGRASGSGARTGSSARPGKRRAAGAKRSAGKRRGGR